MSKASKKQSEIIQRLKNRSSRTIYINVQNWFGDIFVYQAEITDFDD